MAKEPERQFDTQEELDEALLRKDEKNVREVCAHIVSRSGSIRNDWTIPGDDAEVTGLLKRLMTGIRSCSGRRIKSVTQSVWQQLKMEEHRSARRLLSPGTASVFPRRLRLDI